MFVLWNDQCRSQFGNTSGSLAHCVTYRNRSSNRRHVAKLDPITGNIGHRRCVSLPRTTNFIALPQLPVRGESFRDGRSGSLARGWGCTWKRSGLARRSPCKSRLKCPILRKVGRPPVIHVSSAVPESSLLFFLSCVSRRHVALRSFSYTTITDFLLVMQHARRYEITASASLQRLSLTCQPHFVRSWLLSRYDLLFLDPDAWERFRMNKLHVWRNKVLRSISRASLFPMFLVPFFSGILSIFIRDFISRYHYFTRKAFYPSSLRFFCWSVFISTSSRGYVQHFTVW